MITLTDRQFELLQELDRVVSIASPTPAQSLFGAALSNKGLALLTVAGSMQITPAGHKEVQQRISPPANSSTFDR